MFGAQHGGQEFGSLVWNKKTDSYNLFKIVKIYRETPEHAWNLDPSETKAIGAGQGEGIKSQTAKV